MTKSAARGDRIVGLVSSQREMEQGLRRDLRNDMSYERYLRLDQLLDAQRPLSEPEHHDELLFIVQHQTSELWFKLAIHELGAAVAALGRDDVPRCLKGLRRMTAIQRQLFEQWAVLETLTPADYAGFRDVLGNGSGFQSPQYRTFEFLLGNKDERMLSFFAHSRVSREALEDALTRPSLYDEFLRHLARQGHAVPAGRLERDWWVPAAFEPELLPVLRAIYEAPERQWPQFELCEQLVDVEERFQLWRFRHMKAVERVIGSKRGTAGSSGIDFLRAALDQTFFPELIEVRTVMGR